MAFGIDILATIAETYLADDEGSPTRRDSGRNGSPQVDTELSITEGVRVPTLPRSCSSD